VNILTNLAYHKRKISVFGGDQLRPNIHIKDMVRVYLAALDARDEQIAGEIFNAGYENMKVSEIAHAVQRVIGDDVELITTPTDDNRSYHISSKKIADKLGFHTAHTIEEAVLDMKKAFDDGLLPDSLDKSEYFNIKQMQKINLE
jgi:nucleoside-diphosphate-sugar epimerase